jgi:hypothetical protein
LNKSSLAALQSFFGLRCPNKKIIKLSYLKQLKMVAAIFKENEWRSSFALYDAESLNGICEKPITISDIVNEVIISCKDEFFSNMRRLLKRSKPTIEIVAVFE